MLEKYYSETAWSAFYAERVNNIGYINAFGNKYKKLINFIDTCLNMHPDLIVKEEGCGIGNVSKAHYLFGKNKAKYYKKSCRINGKRYFLPDNCGILGKYR